MKASSEIIVRYINGETALAIGLDLGLCHQTIINRLRKAGVEIRTTGGTITRAHGIRIAQEYASGKSSAVVAKELGVTAGTVIANCRRHGIAVRTRGDYPAARIHRFNERFFATWTPDMAYILGLVTTDGNIEGRYRTRIYQKETGLLDQVRDCVSAEMKYRMCGPTSNPTPTLCLNSRAMVRDLTILGLHPNKSKTIRCPKDVPYPKDYVRGVFDGDGHGGFYVHHKTRELSIGFTSGSVGFLRDIMDLLPTNIGGPYENRGCFDIHTNSPKQAVAIRDWMYGGESHLGSPRKRIKLFAESSVLLRCSDQMSF